MNVEQKIASLDHRTDSILTSFDSHFSSVLSSAQARTLMRLRSKLALEEGTVRSTAANLRVIRALPQIFRQSLAASGYDSLVTNFLSSFDGGMSTMEDVLRTVTDGYKIKPVTYTNEDLAYFDQLKVGTAYNLEDAVSRTAQLARRNTLFTVGGNPFEATAVMIAERLHIALGEASTIAATGISTFYRTLADKGYEKIEDSLAPRGKKLEYTYVGSKDKLTRPFCEKLLVKAAAGRTWTRAQIDAMDNEQLDDVFRTGGGFNCRHQWVVALDR